MRELRINIFVKCILVVSIIVFVQGILCIFSLHLYVHIRTSDPHMNTSAISNMIIEPQIRVFIFLSLIFLVTLHFRDGDHLTVVADLLQFGISSSSFLFANTIFFCIMLPSLTLSLSDASVFVAGLLQSPPEQLSNYSRRPACCRTC
jgi:hypothetical protein